MPVMTLKQTVLTTDAASALCQAAMEHAKTLNVRICVSVVDLTGLPLATVRMNGAPIISAEVARKKAVTSVAFGKPSKEWQIALAERQNALMALQSEPDFTYLGGGFPIELDGHVVAAIGVSGATEQQDIDCAQYAIQTVLHDRDA